MPVQLFYFYLLLITFATLNFKLFAETMNWDYKCEMPAARRNLAVAVCDDKIYALGGYGQPVSGPEKTNYVYSPGKNKWEQKRNMTTPRANFGLVTVGHKVFAIGGDPFVKWIEYYEPETDTWNSCTPMPTGRQNLSCCAIEDNIYAISGAEGVGGICSVNEMYNLNTKKWESKAPIPTPRQLAGSAVVGGKIYIIGGLGADGSTPISTVEVYDPATDKWEQRSSMPTARFGFGTAIVNNKIYTLGGDYAALPLVEIYDPVTDTWTTGDDMPSGKKLLGVCSIKNEIYAIGGCDVNLVASRSVETAVIEGLSATEIKNDFSDKNCEIKFDRGNLVIDMISEPGTNYEVVVYDLLGNVASVFDFTTQLGGKQSVSKSLDLSSGAYLVMVKGNNFSYTGKVTLVK